MADHGPLFAGRYSRRVERRVVACPEKYASLPNVEVDRAVRPQGRLQSASLAVVQRRRFAKLVVFYEMMAFEIRYHGNFLY